MEDTTSAPPPAPAPAPQSAPAPGGGPRGGEGGHRPHHGHGGPRGEGGRGGPYGRRDRRGPRKKVCRFCASKIGRIDVRDIALLKAFLSERGRIISKRTSGNCARHQRQVTRGIKRARHAALLPYSVL